MKNYWLTLNLVLGLSLVLGAGCGDSAGDVVCEKEDSTACASSKASCVSACVADEACLRDCQLKFCDCLEAAKCDPPSECRVDTRHDSGGGVFEDGGWSVNEDSGSNVDEDSGSNVDEDSGVLPADDTMPISCPQEDSNACAQEKISCVSMCLADEECLDECQVDFCDCMDWAGCAPPPDCEE